MPDLHNLNELIRWGGYTVLFLIVFAETATKREEASRLPSKFAGIFLRSSLLDGARSASARAGSESALAEESLPGRKEIL